MILLTGATGYIASHTWLALAAAGHEVAGIDDFSNSSPEVLGRLAALGADTSRFVRADVRDRAALDRLFAAGEIEAVVHFAALKAVGESVAEPLRYYAVNVGGLVALAEAMQAHGCKTIVFSSSATVYGQPERLPIREDAPLAATSPYGATKLVSEGILKDVERSDPSWRVALLRYFNPVGAHESGTIGEDPRGVPNNLMPYVAQVAVGKRPFLQVFGNDYETPDGTGVRDYLHVMDLAEGHVAALGHLLGGGGSLTVNLGTGRGTSVLELVHAFERASGKSVPYRLAPRRPGDVAACWADPSLAAETIGWRAKRDVDAMCADTWRWQTANPDGYASRGGDSGV
jgi:UDP-glucose 4-epimerase